MVKNTTATQIEDLGDLLAFPVLTREIGTSAPSSGGGSSSSATGAASLAQIVENALRNALSWRPRAGDAQGFVAALSQSFTCRDVEGRMECRWTPRGSVGVQATLGGVTGAQASLYAQARNTLDQVLPLLEGLRPLQQDADLEDTASLRTIVRSELIELVNELGTLGGPRINRANQLFRLLTGPMPDDDDGPDSASQIRGQLLLLQERLGLTRSRVNTIDEEQVYTNYLTLVSYLVSLRSAWIAQRASFRHDKPTDPNAEGFLGTQLVLISRELAVLSESVRELYFVMDSVFIGPAERATRVLDLSPDAQDLTVTELFDWIDDYVTDEAPRLLQDSGKDGLTAFKVSIRHLRRLVELALRPRRNPIFANQRLHRAVSEILLHLTSALAASERVTRMRIRSVALDGSMLKVTGENFSSSLIMRLRFGLPGAPIVKPALLSVDPDLITASVTGLQPGCWTVEVINPDMETAEQSFSIGSGIGSSILTNIAPDHGSCDARCLSTTLTVAGVLTATTHLVFTYAGAPVEDPGEIVVRSLSRVPENPGTQQHWTAILDLTNACSGLWRGKAVDCGTEATGALSFRVDPCDCDAEIHIQGNDVLTLPVQSAAPPVEEPPASTAADKEPGDEATPPRKPRPGTKS